MTKTRHGYMADGLSALLSYRDRPEPDAPIVVEKTNWSVVPANDNNPEDVEDMRLERRLEIVPSIKAIREAIDTGDVERNDAGQVVGIGKLRFSDGTQTERAYCYGPEGKLVRYDAKLPVGAMIGTKEKADAQAGPGENPEEIVASNAYFREMFGCGKHRYIVGTRKRRTGVSYTAAESAAMLEQAWRNTDAAKVTYTFGKPGLPCGSSRAADSFVGMIVGSGKSSGGSIMWEDIASSMVNREIWMETIDALSKDDVVTLDYAQEAKTMQDIGKAHGFVGKRAERMGKHILKAANDNLLAAMKKSAA